MSQQISPSKNALAAGVFNAANFAYGYGLTPSGGNTGGVLLSGNNATGAGSVIVVRSPQPFQPASVVLADGSSLDPYNVNAPITINDANAETVTPTAVSINTDGTVSITANLSHTHGQGAIISSGTAGLQEALNAANAAGGGVVVIDQEWVGLGGTQAILNAATIPANVSIVDNRGPIPVAYSGSTDAITFPARVNIAEINTAGVDAATLATPAAVDAGKLLLITSTTAQAHTVSTAANKIQDGSGTNGDTLTFAAHAGANCLLLAVSGFWQVVALKNVTLSEV